MRQSRAIGAALSVPWGWFVAAFVYYVALTLVAIGGGELSALFIAASYLVPVGIYVAMLVNKAWSALARVQVELWPVTNLVLH